MNVNSNTYTYTYSTILVLIVAASLALVATALKPAQERNIEIEKKQNILASLRIVADKENVEELYNRYIVETYTLNSAGERVEGVDPFYVDMREQMRRTITERNLPAFVGEKNDSSFIVVPVYGKGLWGPIWGYVSLLRQDAVPQGMPHYNIIYGVNFDHQGETPGLGAEITQPFFEVPFQGKSLFNDQGNFVSVQVIKGDADPGDPHAVDAISGGTITSKGLQAMLDSSLVAYRTYFISPN